MTSRDHPNGPSGCPDGVRHRGAEGGGAAGGAVPLAAPVARTPLGPPEDPDNEGVVALFSGVGETDALLRMLAPLPYDIVSGALPEGNGTPERPLLAAIVTDTVEAPLALCKQVSAHCPVALLTGNSQFEFRLAAARAGVDVLLFRPIDQTEFFNWVEHQTERQSSAPLSVLAVDDDPDLADLYAAALGEAGMEVHVVANAAAAFDQLNAGQPDLILLDVQMPEVDGIEIAKIIRQTRRFVSVPIVFVSAERDTVRQLEARRFGGDEFVSKPIDLEHLVSIVRLRAERAKLMRSIMERDGLTGLLNHGRFKERLVHELERCRRTGTEISLAMIDLDRFKQINDTHGHLTGDAVIRALSGSLGSGLRRIDIIGRYGGEEFGVIMLDTPPAAARAAIDRQRRRFGDIAFGDAGRRFYASFSAGVAGSRTHPEIDALIAAADEALYAAKRGGRNRVVAAADAEAPDAGEEAVARPRAAAHR